MILEETVIFFFTRANWKRICQRGLIATYGVLEHF
jgi:hypothetical protein